MTIPYITHKQQEILLLHYRFRFLNRPQIQRLLNHKDYKTINMWLKDLTAKEYLVRIYDPKTFGKNTLPAVYYLGLNGIRFLKTRVDISPTLLRTLYREKDRSENFINQCQLIGDCCLTLRDRSTDKISYSYLTASDFAVSNSPFHFLTQLNPHLYYARQEKKSTRHYLLEYFEPTLPRFSMRKRIRTYLDFFYSNIWESRTNLPFPKILFVCPTKAYLIYVKRFTRTLLEKEQTSGLLIWFATMDQVTEVGLTEEEIWEEI